MEAIHPDLEYLLGVIEHSRLLREKQFDFALLLLDKSDEEISKIATFTREEKTSFEIYALNTLSDNKIIRVWAEGKQALTNDQLQLKTAMQADGGQVERTSILKR